MANGANMKARIGMDTGDFEKGAKKVVKAAQGMGKDIGSSLSEVGRAIGVDAGLLGDLAGRIDRATTLFRGMATAGGNAASSLTKAMTGLGGAIAGLGLTAIIIQFKELNRQAEAFKNSVEGAGMAAAGQAFRQTYRAALDDLTGDAEKGASWKDRTMTALSQMWTDFTHRGATAEQMAEAERMADRSANLARELVDLDKKRSETLVTQAQYQTQINEQLRIAKDVTNSTADKENARAQAVDLINKKYDEQLAIAKRQAQILAAQNSITKDTTPEQVRAQKQAEAEVLQIEAARTQELTQLDRLENKIAGSAGATAKAAKETEEATRLTLELAMKQVEVARQKAELDNYNKGMLSAARFRMDGSLQAVDGSSLIAGATRLEIPALIKPVIDTEAVEMSIIELEDIVTSGVIGMSEAIGELVGNLINGENAWGNFAQAGISVIADMLATVGKAFVTEGIGVLAADAALRFGAAAAPAAIAGGTAMIALASAMKTTMSNAAASWSGGGYSSAVASSGYASGGGSPYAYGKEITVKVTGTLEASGSKLKAVLNNEATRSAVTT